ncbi:unnamed protein product [Amoebophrya sp. A25]|nr:unnamed protein product [Amoebophrya sp. A25]|eukprot:GSA25T00003051001.1
MKSIKMKDRCKSAVLVTSRSGPALPPHSRARNNQP